MFSRRITNAVNTMEGNKITLAIKAKTKDDMIYTYCIVPFEKEKEESDQEFIDSVIHDINDGIINLTTKVRNDPDNMLIFEQESTAVRGSEINRFWADLI